MRRLTAWVNRPRTNFEWTQLALTGLVLGACTIFVIGALHPSKLLLNTTPAGGDMGAHVWAPWYLRHHLLVHGRISGWAPDWYNGFPALTFYFPGPYLVIALLSYVVPYGIAFKLVSVAGLVLMPVCAYAFGRLIGMRFPGPPLLAVATVPFLFDRYFTIWGGNVASTLAGEFSFSISLCFALVFIGVFAKSMETGRYRWLAALLLAATLFSHLLPTFFAIAGAVIVWLLQPSRRRLGIAILIGVVGIAVTAFWLVPFAVRLGYSNDMGWERTTFFMKGLFPWMCSSKKADASVNCPTAATVKVYTEHLKVIVALAGAGALGGLVLRRRATLLITGLGLLFAAAFRYMPQGTLWNARMLPFWYLMLYFAAAACIAESALAVGVLLGRTPRPVAVADLEHEPLDVEGAWAPFEDDVAVVDEIPAEPVDETEDGLVPNRWPVIVTPIVIALVALIFIGQAVPDWQWLFGRIPGHTLLGGSAQQHNPNLASAWANWNYSGYEQKSAYPEYRDIVTTMDQIGKTHGCGRAMWEYESEEDRFGTPMALMLLPKWTKGCIGSQEGLFFESSSTVPLHFLNQSELSPSPSRAMRDLPYRDFNIADGVAHLQLLGVKYYMAISPQAVTAALSLTKGPSPLLTLVANTGTHQVNYAGGTTPGNQSRTWKVFEVAGSASVSPLAYEPVVMKGVPTTGKGWQKIAVSWYQDSTRWDVPLAASGPSQWARVKGPDGSPPRRPVRPAVVTNITMTDDRISFDVDQPGTPVLVKTSYFPNWQAVGANGPWRVTPNSMVVVPTSTHVSLHYGYTPVDNAGRLLTLAGLGTAGVLWWRERLNPGPVAKDEREPTEGEDELEPARVPVGVGRSDDW